MLLALAVPGPPPHACGVHAPPDPPAPSPWLGAACGGLVSPPFAASHLPPRGPPHPTPYPTPLLCPAADGAPNVFHEAAVYQYTAPPPAPPSPPSPPPPPFPDPPKPPRPPRVDPPSPPPPPKPPAPSPPVVLIPPKKAYTEQDLWDMIQVGGRPLQQAAPCCPPPPQPMLPSQPPIPGGCVPAQAPTRARYAPARPHK